MGAGLVYAILFAAVVIIVGLLFKILPTSPFLAYLGVSEFSQYLPYIPNDRRLFVLHPMIEPGCKVQGLSGTRST